MSTQLTQFLRDDAGTPLTPLSGRPLRKDGQSHYEAWLAQARRDPCAYCDAPVAGTVDHIEPQSQPRARGVGSVHSWVNTVGACGPCNQSKGSRPLLQFLLARRGQARRAGRG